ncbi:MAG: energy-coupling factor transport system permease protein [Bacillota bacterium]|nr:energy-coupling factor transport system permease protein [Bacillota bacterium]
MFLEYIPGQSIIHRLDVRTKVVAFICLMVVLFLFRSPAYNAAIVLVVAGIAAAARLPARRLWGMLGPLVPVFVIIMVIAGFTYPASMFTTEAARRVLFYSWPGRHLPVSAGGILYGLTLLLRILTMVVASSVLTLTTPLDDFLQLLRAMRVPYEMSFIITTGIRFVPTMEKKAAMVLDAQRARGAMVETGGMIQRIKAYVPVMVPMIVDSIRMSENLACAMLNRGYGATRNWTTLRKMAMRPRDYLVLAACAALTVAAVAAARRGYGAL